MDFLIDQNKTKQAFDDAKKDKIFRSNTQGVGNDSIDDDPLLDAFQDADSMAKIGSKDEEARYRDFKEQLVREK